MSFQDKELEIVNEQSEIDRLFTQINETLEGSNLYLNHMNIDGVEVYDDYYEYILGKLNDIQSINIKVITLKQWIDNMMVTMKGYLDRVVPETVNLSDQFYQNQTAVWDRLGQLIEGLQWITSTLNTIDSMSKAKPAYANWHEYINLFKALQDEFINLEGALHNKDAILIGDILKYEMIPVLENLQEIVNNTMDNEVVRHDLN